MHRLGRYGESAAVKERLEEQGALEPLGERKLKNVAEAVECFGLTS